MAACWEGDCAGNKQMMLMIITYLIYIDKLVYYGDLYCMANISFNKTQMVTFVDMHTSNPMQF